jgi:acetyltransferase-like isoleucine patch superfamily enzyme
VSAGASAGAAVGSASRRSWRDVGPRTTAVLRRLRVRVTAPTVRLGEGVRLAPNVSFQTFGGDPIVVGRGTKLGRGAILSTNGGSIEIGAECSIQPYCVLYGHGGLRIGDHVRMATHTVVIPANHVFGDIDRPIAEQGETREGIVVEDDVWIGANVTILDGVTVGRGSIVAAGAVVTRDVPALSIAGGCPARVIGWRGEGNA